MFVVNKATVTNFFSTVGFIWIQIKQLQLKNTGADKIVLYIARLKFQGIQQ